MSEPPRRRRSSGYTPANRDNDGGFPLWPLLVVIVVLGFFIGGVLAHFLGAPKLATQQRTVRPTALPTVYVTAAPVANVAARPSAAPTVAPRISPNAAATVTRSIAPTPQPTVEATTAPTVAPTRAPTVAPTIPPTAAPTHKPLPTPPAATPAPAGGTTGAGVARAYIGALAGGNRSSAQRMLVNGSVDQDSFVDASAQITGMRTTHNADGTSKVDVDLKTASGTYLVTFIVEGGRIIDHSAVESP